MKYFIIEERMVQVVHLYHINYITPSNFELREKHVLDDSFSESFSVYRQISHRTGFKYLKPQKYSNLRSLVEPTARPILLSKIYSVIMIFEKTEPAF